MERGFETMKKTLAIVLALVMALCMIPAVSAGTYKSISDKSYDIEVYSWAQTALGNSLGSATSANTVTAKYEYETEKNDVTGKYTEDKKMAIVKVTGFDASLTMTDCEVTIDGKKLSIDSGASYQGYVGYDPNTKTVYFPVEMTKAGYTDTYVISVVGTTSDDETITETAKVTLKMVNESEYKTAKTATISNIVADSDFNDKVDAYIVGSKIYLDYYTKAASAAVVDITFANENGVAFSEVTWVAEPDSDSTNVVLKNGEQKLDESAAPFYFNGKADTDIVFNLETASALYETKEYDLVIRTGVTETDPKGIYFADASKTIAIGQKYTPVVMGVATGRAVNATLAAGTSTDAQVIDVDGSVVVGTKEGVAYITASYTTKNGQKYTASSMKIVVTGDAVDVTVPSTSTTYKVTATTLNLRKGPGTSYAKAGTLSYGATVEVESIANGWAKLVNGTYASAQYLRAVTTSSSDTTTMYVTCRILNVRSGAGTSYSKVGTLSRNESVEVVSVSNGWAQLSDGTYVAYKYLTL